MPDKSLISDDASNDGSMLDSYAATGTAVVEPGEGVSVAKAEWTGARCEKCEAPLVSDVVSICRRCGWYASLGQFVEVDPEWEMATEPQSASVEAAPRPSHLQVWLGLLPRWSWVIIASVLVLIIESVVARFATPADSSIRTTWSLSQLTIGLLAAFGCHVFNFLVLTADDAEIGAIDLLMKPLKLWGRAFQNLPSRLWVVNTAISGLAAALLSLLVIGGIPYDRLWDWGFKAPPKQDLMGAIMERVQELEGDGEEDLEKSINDFAGKAGDESTDETKVPAKPKQNADCVILGFQLHKDASLASLVLGTATNGQLVYAGNVSPKMGEDELTKLTRSLKSIATNKPLLHIEIEATWVKPIYACRVNYGERSPSGRLREIEWNALLGSIENRTRGK